MKNLSSSEKLIYVSKASIIVLTIPILTWIGAKLKIYLPFTPVPITFQTFFVFVCASLTEWHLSVSGQIIYLLAALSGIPVTTSNLSGVSLLLSPTSGYIIGFIISSFFISKFSKKYCRTFLNLFLIFLMGNLIIYFFGVLRLSFNFGIKNSLKIGVLPFIFGDLIKIFLAIPMVKFLRHKIK